MLVLQMKREREAGQLAYAHISDAVKRLLLAAAYTTGFDAEVTVCVSKNQHCQFFSYPPCEEKDDAIRRVCLSKSLLPPEKIDEEFVELDLSLYGPSEQEQDSMCEEIQDFFASDEGEPSSSERSGDNSEQRETTSADSVFFWPSEVGETVNAEEDNSIHVSGNSVTDDLDTVDSEMQYKMEPAEPELHADVPVIVGDITPKVECKVESALEVPADVELTIHTIYEAQREKELAEEKSLHEVDGLPLVHVVQQKLADKSSPSDPDTSTETTQPSERMNDSPSLTSSAGKELFQCSFCDKKWEKKSSWQAHERTHVEKKAQQCLNCSEELENRRAMRDDVCRQPGVKPFLCPFCPERFYLKRDAQEHKKMHAKDIVSSAVLSGDAVKDFRCSICDKLFKCKYLVQRHAKIHSRGNLLRPIHPRLQAGKDREEMKQPSSIAKRPGFRCSLCFRRYSDYRNAQAHEQTHPGLKPFKCSLCDYRFFTEYAVKEHKERTHS